MVASLLSVYTLLLISLAVKVFGEQDSPPSSSYNQKDSLDISNRLNGFSFDFYRQLARVTSGNILFSPFSIFTGFTMLGIGARGRTKTELSTVLKWGRLERMVEQLKPLYTEMSRRNASGARVEIANKLWVSNDVRILKQYRRTLSYYFQTKIGKKSFSSNPEVARKSINHWIAQRTNKNIKHMFPVRSFSSMTRLVLGNAIYFKGNWAKPFDPMETQRGKFYLSNGKHVNVDYMTTEDKFPAYFDDERNVQLLEIPYSGNTYSMILVLPEVTDIADAENTINADIMNEWIRTLTSEHTNWSSKFIYLPKFQLEQSLPLSKLLQALSLRDIFQPSTADLSGIAGQKTLYCSNALHKASIKIDEEGTVSSAATGIGITMLSYPMTIRIERPFLFYIIHKSSKTIIFSGKVMNPRESNSCISPKDVVIENNDRIKEVIVDDIEDAYNRPSETMSEEDKLTIPNSAEERIVVPLLLLLSPILSIVLPRHWC